jgi:4-amino-4-deoxy-L-arabinose transferase-like glycosyltransferase
VSDKSRDPEQQELSLLVEPGTKVRITIETGREIVEGKVPLTVRLEPASAAPSQTLASSIPEFPPTPTTVGHDTAVEARSHSLATWLFVLALAVYLVTRLIGLTRFPIYFFTDEAVQTQSIAQLIGRGYRDSTGTLFPAYFRNGEYYNLGTSVYVQWLPYVLFGQSAVATRATSVLVTLLAAFAIGIVLRDVFKLKYWWTGTLFLSIAPAWFLHSRTAFETAEFVAFYAGAFGAYLLYRYRSPRYLFPAVLLGALAFYTYSPAQVIVPLTAVGFLASDWRYHWRNRRTVLAGLALALLLALPYVRFRINAPDVAQAHLHTLSSYWFDAIPLPEKIRQYLSEYAFGLSPRYWYLPNDRDLSRHLMKGYGHILIATLPLALLGAARAVRNLKSSAYRAVLIALLVSPAAAALVQVGITRVLVFVVPAAILTAIGFERVLRWIESPKKRLRELAAAPGPTWKRIVASLIIALVGIPIALLPKDGMDRIALTMLVIILALQVSGAMERLARALTRGEVSRNGRPKRWNSANAVALSAFAVLAGTNFHMLNDSLRNSPLWYRDYGLGGMQYGAFQVFDVIERYLAERPDTKVIFSPDWANGADDLARFFLGDPAPVQIGSIRGHITQKLPLDPNTVFIMTPEEYSLIKESPKLTDIRVERVVPYPDGKPGFYFVRLRYSDEADRMFAAEKAARQALQETVVTIDGAKVKVRYPFLDSDLQAESMALVFDGDPYTVAKTFESNPFVIEMTFPAPRTVRGFSIIIGSATARITLKCRSRPGVEPTVYSFEGQGTRKDPELSFDLPKPTEAQVLTLEMLDPHSPEQAKVHVWEVKLR